MDIKYKVYNANELDTLDLSLFYDTIRWNLNNTQFLVEFINQPTDTTDLLNTEEARALVRSKEWYTDGLN